MTACPRWHKMDSKGGIAMDTHERFARIYAHQEADRIPIIDSPWAGTLRRWRREGMPVGMDWEDHFGIDKLGCIGVDISPRYEVEAWRIPPGIRSSPPPGASP